MYVTNTSSNYKIKEIHYASEDHQNPQKKKKKRNESLTENRLWKDAQYMHHTVHE